MRPVAIFRFSPTEGPGRFGEWLARHEVPQRLIAIDRGESVPADAGAFSGIAMMGGPMSANDDLPWNAPLMDLLAVAMRSDIAVLGHCLGGQLLAKALGAKVSRSATPEIGWGEVRVLGAHDWFGSRDRFAAFHWHYEIFALPRGATRVLTNAWNPDQAFRLGKHVGFQCHIEMTRPMVESWCSSGAAELPERSAAQVQSRADMLVDLDARLTALSGVADDFYARWAKGLAS
jgi:GMP synthase-like glutamine amidotransferase